MLLIELGTGVPPTISTFASFRVVSPFGIYKTSLSLVLIDVSAGMALPFRSDKYSVKNLVQLLLIEIAVGVIKP